MIESMTGFGRGTYETEERTYQVEIKSVNHKYTDISIKMPRVLSYLEEKIKQELLQQVNRGKIDVFVNFINYSNKGKKIKINQDLALNYIQQLRELSSKGNLINNINVMEVAKLPEVLTIENTEDEEVLTKELMVAVNQAIQELVNARKIEGEKIAQDINKRVDTIAEKVEKISAFSTGLVEEYVVKLKERIKEILKTNVLDENRLAQEVVIYADKCSIEEELTRLRSHIKELKHLIESKIPIGKNMDFLIQEMNREINTIGSKANCLEITKLVVEVKTIMEDIREQIQNIE